MQQKRVDSAITESRDGPHTKRQKRVPAPFAFYPKDWTTMREIDKKVSVLKARSADRRGPQLIVKKILVVEPNSTNDPRPFEIRALALLPRCNRVVHALTCVATDDPAFGIGLFEYYPMGDLVVWKEREFDSKNRKPVPESFIWRFFTQIAQALAFLQGSIGPEPGSRQVMLHRDIKPRNILVVDIGTTYPSFKLHDFGCATLWREGKQHQHSWCGTFDWQPPENPLINTVAAEIWALGACVHFLATGQKPIADTKTNREACLDRAEKFSEDQSDRGYYSSSNRYVAARVPRRVIPINLDAATQIRCGVATQASPNPQYSDELNDWMAQCLRFAPEERATTQHLLSDMSTVAQGMLRRMGGRAALADMEMIF
ncbi:hypothetical protein OPT61_g8111 [Boeremia exigua]|uniref:Uncharacterized protein n=1 Tax=Boeremia exigua TaxID=749465 RepID=A0ACC2I0P4_9PLEO|nr:hypothetical protein OPT61_g8111 [Boeremia exigua]